MRRALRWVLAAVGAVVVLLAGGYAVFALRGDDAPPPPALSHGAAGGPAAGRFAVAPSTGMFAGYRVREHYLGVGTRTAVGRTPAVTGNLTLDGSRVTAARLVADLSQLQSDQAGRDKALRVRAIETARYPRATFALERPFRLASGAQSARGTLELHGHRAPLRLTVSGQRAAGGALELVGSGRVEFRPFAIDAPSVAGLVKVEDHGVLEFRLRLRPAS